MFNVPKKIRVCEVSTRDGMQNLPWMVGVDEKVRLLDMMVDAGIKEIEVGSFLPDTTAFPLMANTPEVFAKMHRKEGVVYRALLQTPAGARQAVEYGCNKFKINTSASRKHFELMTNRTLEEGLKGFTEIGQVARENNVKLLGSISLAFASPFGDEITYDTLRTIIDGFLEIGVTQISLNDTAGLATPVMVNTFFKDMMAYYPNVEVWAFHPHNTRGSGLANVVAALDAGVEYIDSSLAGTGGCNVVKGATGNISTEDLVYMLQGMGIDTGIDFDKLIEAGLYVEELAQGNSCDSYILNLEHFKRAAE